MFGPLGFQELLFIFALALLIFGPKKLPQIGRTLGRGLAEFRKASNDLRRTINAEMIEQELRDSDPRRAVKDSLQDLKRGLDDDAPAQSAKSTTATADASEAEQEPEAPGDGDPTFGDSDEVVGAAGTIARGSVSRPAGGSPSDDPTADRRDDESAS